MHIKKVIGYYWPHIKKGTNYQEQTAQFSGEIELDESYFDDKRKVKTREGEAQKKRFWSLALKARW